MKPVTPFPISMTVTKESPVLGCLRVDRLTGGWHGGAHNRPASVLYSRNGWIVEPLILISQSNQAALSRHLDLSQADAPCIVIENSPSVMLVFLANLLWGIYVQGQTP